MSEINGQTSDGYHTFDELYEHRHVLFIALCRYMFLLQEGARPKNIESSWMSKLHSDGSSFDGWFIAGIGVRKGEQITYHLPMSMWDEMKNWAIVFDRAPEWDGHKPADVVERLRRL